jgi:ankyrin repeat protein
LQGDPTSHKEFWSESILTLAVPYPGSLKYLLGRGAEVDEANGFGKTPLMYAAQYDQWESAKILLDAGADPNATTFIPQDSCNYTLRTDAMTPLHYAARYGSARLINLLLERGALTFGERPSDPGGRSDAIYWVTTNPKISPQERSTLSAKLRAPAAAERIALSRAWVARAEAEYASGKPVAAFRTLRNGFLADDTNQQAIADLPLLALRANRSGDAMHAANYALAHFKAPLQRAAALFNKGLVCQYISAQGRKESWEVPRMCNEDFMQMFVTSYDLDGTPVRAQALERALAKDGPGMCTVEGLGDKKMRIWEYGGPFAEPWSISKYAAPRPMTTTEGYRVYVLHRPDQPIDPSSIHWVTPPSGARPANQAVEASPHLIATYGIGGDELTVIEANFTQTGIRGEVLMIGGQRCEFKDREASQQSSL